MGREKVSAGWKKRVKIEYARLRSQKKFRLQDDIRVAWRNNRVAMKGAHIKKEEEAEKPLQNEQNEVIGERAKPIWICSEDPPRQATKINVIKKITILPQYFLQPFAIYSSSRSKRLRRKNSINFGENHSSY